MGRSDVTYGESGHRTSRTSDMFLYEPQPRASELGTNAILEDIGLQSSEINALFETYDKGTIKSASRIAHKTLTYGQQSEFYNLLEAVYRFGAEDTHNLVLNLGIQPADLLHRFDVSDANGFNILTPTRAKVPLELIVSNSGLSADLELYGLSHRYSGQKTMLFDYKHQK